MNIPWPLPKTTSIDDLLSLHKSPIPPFVESFAPSVPSIHLGGIPIPVLVHTYAQDRPCRRFVVDMNGALVYNGAGFVVTGTDHTATLLYNACIDPIVHFGEWSNIHKALPSTTANILKGVTLLVSGTWGDSFYHFLFETIGRCATFERCCYAFSDVDTIVFSYPVSDIAMQWFHLLGFGDKVIVAPSSFLYCERLLLPSLSTCGVSLETVAYLRNRVPVRRDRTDRRIFVSRGQARNGRMIVNEEAVLDFLKPYGFEKVAMDGLTLHEQARLFASASHIIAANGGSLSNLVFASPGSRVLELFGKSYVNPHILQIANQVNMKHYHVVCEEVDKRGHFSNYRFDIETINLEPFLS